MRGNPRYVGYGWIPDTPDHHDYKYGDLAKLAPIAELPSEVDLGALEQPIEDQEHAGSCVGHGVTSIGEMLWAKDKGLPLTQHFSRRFLYYIARAREGSQNEDSGCMIRDAIMGWRKAGCCLESTWVYDDDLNKITEHPSPEAYLEAKEFQVLRAYRLQNTKLNELLTCLADDYAFAFGVTLYDSFERVGSDGLVSMPRWSEVAIGGHCMAAVGYDLRTKLFRVRNSWGRGWGADGYCWMPFEYLTDDNLAADFWTIRAGEQI